MMFKLSMTQILLFLALLGWLPQGNAVERPAPVWQSAKLINIQTVDQVRTDYISLGGFTDIPESVKLRYYFLTIRVETIPYMVRFYRDANGQFKLPWQLGDSLFVRIKGKKAQLKMPSGKRIKGKIIPFKKREENTSKNER